MVIQILVKNVFSIIFFEILMKEQSRGKFVQNVFENVSTLQMKAFYNRVSFVAWYETTFC